MGLDNSTDIPQRSIISLSKRKEKFPYDKSNSSLRAQIEDYQLADLVGDYGILNRRAIENRLQKMAKRMIMGNLDEFLGFAVAYGDLDGLKQINGVGGQDKGHDMGDAAVINVAEKMSRIRPGRDIIARFSGDEFGVIMHATSREEAQMIMIGNNEREGYIQRTQFAVEQGRQELKRHFGERWVKDLPDKKPGNVTMGWNFLSREDFINLYNNWKSDVQNNKPGVGDFSTYVFRGADISMFENKT